MTSEVLRLIDAFRGMGLYVGSVVITQYAGPARGGRLQASGWSILGVQVYLPLPDRGLSHQHAAASSATRATATTTISKPAAPLVVVTAPGPGSGKMATCLSQLYHEYKRGVKAGYAKFETFPIWNLPLKHPVNLAYEAATADLNDVNMIDPFHLEAYGETTVNYNRDVEIFPVLNAIFEKIHGRVALQVAHRHGREHGRLLHHRRRRLLRGLAGRRSSAGIMHAMCDRAQRRGRGRARATRSSC